MHFAHLIKQGSADGFSDLFVFGAYIYRIMEMPAHLSYKQRQADLVTHASPEEELIYRAGQIMNTVRMTFVE